MKQIAIADWPQGLCRDIALIDDRCAPRLGLTFEAYDDDNGLGLQFAALVEIEAGVFAIRRGTGAPSRGLVLVSMETTVADGGLEAFAEAFAVDATEILWRANA